MYGIYFYEDRQGNCPIADYIEKLGKRKDKESRIKLKKIREYLKVLQQYGTRAGEPYVKHLKNRLWELRPLKDRIIFVSWVNGNYVLLHHFAKKTKKTPPREIETAMRLLDDLEKRGVNYE